MKIALYYVNMNQTEKIYHIYVNGSCVKNCLSEEEFHNEMKHIQAFLELTNLQDCAKVTYEELETSQKEFSEASY